ncbi:MULTISPECIES: DinB family protein [Amycolatopsis]|uniref:DinB family protein n=2 Tax=Pseudonocardiaceae TaxID=2070 RepID=UPI000B8ADCEB|nr:MULTISPECIES: DinB family protein [Amycolatopsis]OXM68182.1 methyltransferase type 12 [Amycolatopsis sp. KNN50.9b]
MITPDTKDWTWVLRTPCPECGFDAGTFSREDVPALLRANAEGWRRALAEPDVRERPAPDKWSTLEYGCHVRDVCRIYLERLRLILTEDGPLFPDWNQDATAIEDRYETQDPRVVADELTTAASRLAEAFAQVSGEQWQRPGTRSDGAQFTTDTFARYFIHDPLHHLWDVTGQRAG